MKPVTAIVRRFVDEQGIPLRETWRLMFLADKAADANTHACNGDPFPGFIRSGLFPDDKNANAKRWESELDRLTERMREIVEKVGLTVEYTGLRPCLRRGTAYVEIPHS